MGVGRNEIGAANPPEEEGRITLSAAHRELFDANGALLGSGEIKFGETNYVELQRGELVSDFMRYPANHTLRNSGQSRYGTS